MLLKQNKNGQATFQEIIVIAFSFIFVIVIFFFLNLNLNQLNKQKTFSAPILPSQFPSMYINNFLNLPLNKTTIEQFSKQGIQVKTVSDLLLLSSTVAKNDYLLYQKYYEHNTSAALNVYLNSLIKSNSQGLTMNQYNNLLYTVYGVSSVDIPSLDSLISKGNFYYFLSDKNNEFIVVYFYDPSYSNQA